MSQDPSGGKQCRAARHPASRTCVRTWVDGATAARRTSARLPGRAQWPELGRRLAALHLPDLETAGTLLGGLLLGVVPTLVLIPLLVLLLLFSAIKVWRHT